MSCVHLTLFVRHAAICKYRGDRSQARKSSRPSVETLKGGEIPSERGWQMRHQFRDQCMIEKQTDGNVCKKHKTSS
jgi:hypothetical protein